MAKAISSKNRIANKNFFDEYKYLDEILSNHLKIEKNGVDEYINQMKHAVIDVRDVLPEWDSTIERLQKMKARFEGLNNTDSSFDDFQGKDEDVVWMLVFEEKLDNYADPLSKYSRLKFTYKRRKKGLLAKILELFN